MQCHKLRTPRLRRIGCNAVKSLATNNQRGFSLIELMISITLGVVISGAVVQMLVSNQVTDRLNQAIASSQEGGRFIVSRLRSDILMTGRYDPLSPDLNTLVDIADEASFVQNHPIILQGDFINNLNLGSIQAANGGNDTLVIGLQGTRDCRGYKLGYADNEEFYVVNEYFIEDQKLKCRGFDGRVLRGQKAAEGNNNDAAFTLLDKVLNFQVIYGINSNSGNADTTGRPVNYVTADQLAQQRPLGSHVVAVRLALVLEADGDAVIDPTPSFKLLNENSYTPPGNKLYKMFETTITLRNMKNFVRSRKT